MEKQSFISTIVIIILALHSIVITQNSTAANSLTEIDSSKEYDNVLVTGLRNDYRAGFAGILNLFNFSNTGVRKLIRKVSHLEAQQKVNFELERDFGNRISICRKFMKNCTKLQQLQTDVLVHVLLPMSEPIKGVSFGGKTLEEISKSIVGGKTVAVQIKNHLKVSLSGYKLNLVGTVAVLSAPAVIIARTNEVYTFQNSGSYHPECSFLYRIGGTDFALHAYFASKDTERWLAIAFVRNFENPQLLSRATPAKNVSTNAAAFATTNSWVNNATQKLMLNVNDGNLHARADMKYISNGKFTVSIEVFEDT